MLNRSQQIRILSVSSGASHSPLRTLINTRLASLGKELPKESLNTWAPNLPIIGVAITPSADLLVADTEFGDEVTVTSGTRREYWVDNVIDKITLKNAVTVKVELFMGEVP
jgi:hypothetical protein